MTRRSERQQRAQRDLIIEQFMPMVRSVARALNRPRHIEIDDLVSAGTLALISCVDKWDQEFDGGFAAFAAARIRGEMIDHLRREDHLTRSDRKLARQIADATNRGESTTHLAEELGVASHRLATVMANITVVSIDAALTTGDLHRQSGVAGRLGGADKTAWAQGKSAASGAGDPEGEMLYAERAREMASAIDGLHERDRAVLSLYYLTPDATFTSVGSVLGFSTARVCDAHGRVIDRLGAVLTACSGDEGMIS